MTMIEAGTRVKKGYYFSARSWSLHPMPRDGEALPGGAGEKYLHVPMIAAFILTPLMGAAFLMFLPLIGFYLAFHAALRPVVNVFTRSATEIAATVQPGWTPGEAHLTGQHAKGGNAGEDAAPSEGQLASLEKEISARRDERS